MVLRCIAYTNWFWQDQLDLSVILLSFTLIVFGHVVFSKTVASAWDTLERMFGCACWLNLHAYNKMKLSFRCKMCFLGILLRTKALTVSIVLLVVSMCDVVFDEHRFLLEASSHRPITHSAPTKSIILLPF